tara:strand:+ start:451 stop:1368 length:918 start_codon:yes stop_codon:yes gene_type:complete
MAKTLSKSGISTSATIAAWHVTQSIDALTGNSAYNITISGSLNLTGSNVTGSFSGDGSGLTGVTGEWDGSHNGNASITGSLIVTGNTTIDGNSILGSNGLDTVDVNGRIISNLIPNSGNTYILGDSVRTWKESYIVNAILTNITASGNISSSGTIIGGILQANTGISSSGDVHISDLKSIRIDGSGRSGVYSNRFTINHSVDTSGYFQVHSGSGATVVSSFQSKTGGGSGIALGDGSINGSGVNDLKFYGDSLFTSHITSSANISSSGTGSFEQLMMNYDNMPTSDPSIKGVIWRSSTDLKISAG